MAKRGPKRVRSAQVHKEHTDPRVPGGGIAGPGGPNDYGANVIDMTDAVLMGGVTVSAIDMIKDHKTVGYSGIAMEIYGRINKTQEQSRILYVFDVDGAAAIAANILTLAAKMGPETSARLLARIEKLAEEWDNERP